MIKRISDKKDICIICLIYFIFVLVLSSTLRHFFVPIYGDNLYYTEIAKSIANSGKIQIGHMYGPSSQYLYSIILAVIYKYFYNSDTILTTIRTVGVFLMSMAIFPAYILLGKLSIFGKKRIILSITAICLPDILHTWYVESEVIAYPLFMLTLLLVFNDYRNDDSLLYTLAVSIICYIDYTVRSQFLVIIIAYILVIVNKIILQYKKHTVKNLVKKLVVTISFFSTLYIFIPNIMIKMNIIGQGKNRDTLEMSKMISNIKQEFGYHITQITMGVSWYFFWAILSFGIITILIPFFYKGYEESINQFRLFCNYLLILFVAIVAVTIYSAEEPLAYDTHRIHLRYLFYLFIPYLYLLYKIDFKQYSINNICKYIFCMICVYMSIGRFLYKIRENSFWGPETISISIFRKLRGFIETYPNTELWFTFISIAIILSFMLCVRKLGWFFFVYKVFPCVLVLIGFLNIVYFSQKQLYVTKVNINYQAEFVSAANFLNKYDDGEIIAIVENIDSFDNFVCTFQMVNKNSFDIIGLEELKNMISGKNEINLREYNRNGYYYLDKSTYKVLDRASYIVFFRYYVDDIFEIKNDMVYQDNYFRIFKLNNGCLQIRNLNP